MTDNSVIDYSRAGSEPDPSPSPSTSRRSTSGRSSPRFSRRGLWRRRDRDDRRLSPTVTLERERMAMIKNARKLGELRSDWRAAQSAMGEGLRDGTAVPRNEERPTATDSCESGDESRFRPSA